MKPVELPPLSAGDPTRWEHGPLWAQAESTPTGWRLSRSWSPGTLALGEAPNLALRVGEEQAIAQLAEPVGLAPGETLTLWLSWPLELVVRTGEAIHETARAGMRRTMLGSVDKGRVLPAAQVQAMATQQQAQGPGVAALSVRLVNKGRTTANVRRFPVDEAILNVQLQGAFLVTGTQVVEVLDDSQAQVRVEPLPEHPDAVALPRPPVQRPVLHLSWLLDSTRRSVGFQL